MKYKFLFDRRSGQYKGITYDDKADNTTSVRPIFSAGFVTCWCFDSNRWKLVPDESFFVQMADVELIKAVDTRIINAIGMHYEAISESLKVYDAAMIARFEMVLKSFEKNYWSSKEQSDLNHKELSELIEESNEQLRQNALFNLRTIELEIKKARENIIARFSFMISLRGRWERLKAEISRWFQPL